MRGEREGRREGGRERERGREGGREREREREREGEGGRGREREMVSLRCSTPTVHMKCSIHVLYMCTWIQSLPACRCFGLLISPGKDVKNSEMNLLDNMVGCSHKYVYIACTCTCLLTCTCTCISYFAFNDWDRYRHWDVSPRDCLTRVFL